MKINVMGQGKPHTFKITNCVHELTYLGSTVSDTLFLYTENKRLIGLARESGITQRLLRLELQSIGYAFFACCFVGAKLGAPTPDRRDASLLFIFAL